MNLEEALSRIETLEEQNAILRSQLCMSERRVDLLQQELEGTHESTGSEETE